MKEIKRLKKRTGFFEIFALLLFALVSSQTSWAQKAVRMNSSVTTDGLVAYYPFNGNANDESGNGNHGTPTAAVVLAIGVNGDADGAYQFGGPSNPGHICVPNSESLQFTNGATFAAYIKPTSWYSENGNGRYVATGGTQCFFAKDHDRSGVAFGLSGNDNEINLGSFSFYDKWAELGKNPISGDFLNKWTHVAYVFDDGYARLYVDGKLLDERESTPNFSTMNSRNLYIGKFSDSWYPFNGLIDEVRIYNRALTKSEIKAISQFAESTVSNTIYTVTPSEWTNVPSTNVTQGSRTIHGGLLQAKATVSGKTATFALKKKDGSVFNNRGHIVVHYDSYDGTIVKSNVSYEAGITNPTVDVDLDFTSGRRRYVIVIKSGDIFYYTRPITISADDSYSDTDLTIAGGSYFNTPILTTGKPFPFNIEIKNNSSEDWSGSFYLKSGKEDWLQWYEVSIAAGAKKALLTKEYTPISSGRKTLTLYYQTGGSGSGVEVDAGNYENPFTISVADPPSSDKLATPDKNTFSATSVTETSFIANWGAVEGALYYDINVRKKGGDYANSVFSGGSSTTSVKVTGLNPGTSYQFQIRARNNNASQNSDWSASIPTAVSTVKKGTQPANLSIYAVRGFDGKTPLTVGVANTYKVYVVNNGASDWSGSFYLKEGDTNLKPWHNISLVGNRKAVQPLEFDYIPESTGTKTLTLYYQTNTSGSGIPVSAAVNNVNPMTVQVIADPTVNDELKLKSAIVCPETLELGQKATISAEVQNTGDNWEGTIHLTDNGISIASINNLSAGQSKPIYVNDWEPQTEGTHSIGVVYESTNSNIQRKISANGFANPITIEVINADTEMASHGVYIYHITDEVAPKVIPNGAKILYHFRIINKDNIPAKGVVGQFDVEVTSPSGATRNYTFTSDPSGYNGVIFLAIHTSDNVSTIINAGESAVIKFKRLYRNGTDGVQNDYTVLNENTLEPISLSVKDDALFSNIEEFNITLDAGVSANLSAGEAALITDPLSKDKEIASMRASASLPVVYSLKKDDSGNISKIGIECGINGSLSAGASVGDWLNFNTEGYIGGKTKNTFSTDDKRAIWLAVANGYEAIRFHTNRLTLIGARAFCNWFHKKQIDVETSSSWFVGYSVGASANLSNNFPDIRPKCLKSLKLPSSFWLDAKNLFNVGANATVKWVPGSEKTIKDKATNSNIHLYGDGRSLKLKLNNFLSSRASAEFFTKKSYWNGDQAFNYFSNYGLDVFFIASKAKLEGAFTVSEEEYYTDSNKQNLYSISNTVDITTTDEIGLNDIPCIGPWLEKEGGVKADLTSTMTLSSKLESKGEFARYLQNASSTMLGRNISKIFPALSGESIIGAPRAHFEAFSEDLIGTIKHLHIEDRDQYPLGEALKLEQKVKSEFEASVSIPFHPGKYLKWNIDARLAFECESYPSESYYSVQDNQFIPVVLQPASSISSEIDGLVTKINNKLNGSFNDTERNEIDEQYEWEKQSAQYGAGSAIAEPGFTFSYDDTHYTLQTNSWATARTKRLHPHLAAEKQNNICKMSIILNENMPNFDSDVSLEFGHFYPAGELLGVTDQGDTLFVVSEVCNLIASKNEEALIQTQNGDMRIETTIGADDLTPFGFTEDTPLDVYYSEDGSEIWHYLGPAGMTIMTNKLGAYMMATSIKNDVIAPEIMADLDEETGILHIKVNENIGLRVNTLSVLVNGMKRDVVVINESNFEVYMTEEDMQSMLTLYITINDLAGNQGSLFQLFNLDKDDPDGIKSLETEKDKTKIFLSKNALKVEGAEPDATVMLFSIKGDVIAKEKTDNSGKAQVRLNHLSSGVYVVTLSNGKTKKFLIK